MEAKGAVEGMMASHFLLVSIVEGLIIFLTIVGRSLVNLIGLPIFSLLMLLSLGRTMNLQETPTAPLAYSSHHASTSGSSASLLASSFNSWIIYLRASLSICQVHNPHFTPYLNYHNLPLFPLQMAVPSLLWDMVMQI